ncbi:hypothetical protein SAMN05880558_112129 [Aeromonas sp. RU39B]|nr:hypothetical protein SAMN05880558_112129 [Aeromonas sp. RU39B]
MTKRDEPTHHPPPLSDHELAFLDWLRGRGSMTVSEAIDQGACLELNTDRHGVLYTMTKLVRHNLINVTIQRHRLSYGVFGQRRAFVRVYHTGGDSHG